MKKILAFTVAMAMFFVFTGISFAGSNKAIWETDFEKVLTLEASGTNDTNVPLTAAATSLDNSDATVTLLSTAHGWAVGSQIFIAGTTNYNGTHTLTAVATNTFTFAATYVEEIMDGTETVSIVLDPLQGGNQSDFKITEVRFNLDATDATAELFSINLDAAAGSAYDVVLFSESVATIQDIVWVPNFSRYFRAGDKVNFVFPNADADTYGIEVIHAVK